MACLFVFAVVGLDDGASVVAAALYRLGENPQWNILKLEHVDVTGRSATKKQKRRDEDISKCAFLVSTKPASALRVKCNEHCIEVTVRVKMAREQGGKMGPGKRPPEQPW